jgi:hypothetical protein
MNDYWFKPHRLSVAVPSTWEGWLCLVALGLLQILILKDFPPSQRPIACSSAMALSFLMFVWLAWIKTDGDWRLGAKR